MTLPVRRISVVTPWDVSSPTSWSGAIAPMVAALTAEFDQVDIVGVPGVVTTADRLLGRVSGARGALHLPAWSPSTARRRSGAVARELARLPVDVPIVALAATPELLQLKKGRRIVQVTDSSFAALTDSYPAYSRLAPAGRRAAEKIERTVAAKTSQFLVATAWSRDRLVEDVGVAPDSITIARFGPAIAPPPRPRAHRREGATVRLLFIASDWQRKGGDIAVATVEELWRRGLDVSLTVVGAPERSLPERIVQLGRLQPAALSTVYSEHHALLEPSMASAGGMVVTDALHHGLPVIASAVGGLTDLVRDGETGWLVPVHDSPVPFIETISDRVIGADLPSMSARARDWAQQEAGWARWAHTVRNAVEHETSSIRY